MLLTFCHLGPDLLIAPVFSLPWSWVLVLILILVSLLTRRVPLIPVARVILILLLGLRRLLVLLLLVLVVLLLLISTCAILSVMALVLAHIVMAVLIAVARLRVFPALITPLLRAVVIILSSSIRPSFLSRLPDASVLCLLSLLTLISLVSLLPLVVTAIGVLVRHGLSFEWSCADVVRQLIYELYRIITSRRVW